MASTTPRLTDAQICVGLRALGAETKLEHIEVLAVEAANRIEALRAEVRQAHKDAQEEARGIAEESYWQGKQEADGDYGSY